jgi:GntR family L-lactate dehydrogenase operon transcriptional regulator
MRLQRDNLHDRVLEILAGSDEPAGSGAIHLQLARSGFSASQPTVGRVLFDLDADGLTTRVSNKGRRLTAEGRRRFAEARARHSAERVTAQAFMALGRSTLEELRQAMVARRAIEREIARLAAERADARMIAELRDVVEAQRRAIESGLPGAEHAVAFHLALAEHCGNPFLANAASLVRTSMAALQRLMYHLGASVGESYCDHASLLTAIEARDAAAAENAMLQHMDELIGHVEASMDGLSAREDAGTTAPVAR